MPPDPSSGSRLRRSRLASLCFETWLRPWDRNKYSLEISLSATEFCHNYCRVPRNFARTIAECCEISLQLSQSAAKFHSNYRGVPRNIAVAQTIGLTKYRRKIAPNEISLIIVELRLHYFCTIL